MKPHQSILTLVAVCALAACGGGGGGTSSTTTPTATTPVVTPPVVTPPVATTPQVAITASNAKAVGSVALEAVGNPLALLGVSTVVGLINKNLTPTAFTQPQACANGGNAVLSGSVANPALFAAGDKFTATYSSCGVASVATNVIVLTGSIVSTLSSNTATRSQLETTLEALGVTAINKTFEFTGNQRTIFDSTNAAAPSYVLSGTNLKVKTSGSGIVRTGAWQDYVQTIIAGSTATSYSMSATIQTDNTNIASSSSTFVVNTTTSMVRNNSTGLLSAGAFTVAGAANSRLSITINADGTATIQVDANGDGVFETTVTSTAVELATLL